MMNINQIIVLSLFAGFTGKALYMGASVSDAAVILILAAAHFFHSTQIQNKRIDELKQELKAIDDKQAARDATMAEIKDTMSSVKVANGLRTVR